jgi:nitrate reductase NapE component
MGLPTGLLSMPLAMLLMKSGIGGPSARTQDALQNKKVSFFNIVLVLFQLLTNFFVSFLGFCFYLQQQHARPVKPPLL